ncbi:hypothetical protein [Roseococcus pinisoli]|uniref:Uncharacterized protein n=1 Tax=Roseococcus pinisoli TaxID=2835040 RepID=A0ABS5QJI3_9PROT|nr:hypothetical protein [Roseococcus pinisoli]MBS7813752.1 hypothetical protein [Roseococcus pinisoli]
MANPESRTVAPSPKPSGTEPHKDKSAPHDDSPLSAPENPPGVGTGPITTSNPTGVSGTDIEKEAPEPEEGPATLVAVPPEED